MGNALPATVEEKNPDGMKGGGKNDVKLCKVHVRVVYNGNDNGLFYLV